MLSATLLISRIRMSRGCPGADGMSHRRRHRQLNFRISARFNLHLYEKNRSFIFESQNKRFSS